MGKKKKCLYIFLVTKLKTSNSYFEDIRNGSISVNIIFFTGKSNLARSYLA